jgi:hypothetical protein
MIIAKSRRSRSHMAISRALTVIIFLISTGLTQAVPSQRRSGRTPTRPSNPATPQSSARNTAAESGPDKYWSAQRSIEAAIQQLEAYLREFPDGERAETARQQIAVLRGLTVTSSRPEWTSMDQRRPLSDVSEWRVVSLDPQPEKTRVGVEITCKREDGGNCYFKPFDRYPLVLVDDAGRYYSMLESSALPSDVRDRDDRRAVLLGGRTITVTVDFVPLAEGAISGQIYYRDDNQAKPARFSFARRR